MMTTYLYGYGRRKHIPVEEPPDTAHRWKRLYALCGNWGSPWSGAEPDVPVCKSCERAAAKREASDG